MARQKKTIITCAVTGAIHTPTMSDALPYTYDDIARQAIEAAEAGASILHLHARNPENGSPSVDPDDFAPFLPRIKQATDAVVNLSTGGSLTEPPQLIWSTVMFRKRRTENGKQATEARRDSFEVTAG